MDECPVDAMRPRVKFVSTDAMLAAAVGTTAPSPTPASISSAEHAEATDRRRPQLLHGSVRLESTREGAQRKIGTGDAARWRIDDCPDRIQRRHTGDGHADGRHRAWIGDVRAWFWQNHMLAVNAGVTLDPGDVAALDLDLRAGLLRHRQFDDCLDAGNSVHPAEIAQPTRPQRALGPEVPAEVDVLDDRAQLVGEFGGTVEFDAETIGQQVDAVGIYPGSHFEHPRNRRIVHWAGEPAVLPGTHGMVAGGVDGVVAREARQLV